MQKVQTNSIIAICIWLFAPPMSILTSQTTLPDWQNTIGRSPPPFQKLGQKTKSNRQGDSRGHQQSFIYTIPSQRIFPILWSEGINRIPHSEQLYLNRLVEFRCNEWLELRDWVIDMALRLYRFQCEQLLSVRLTAPRGWKKSLLQPLHEEKAA